MGGGGMRGGEDHRTLKHLILLYFYLLIFEGALRKWILPSLSGPLLIVRDPVAILIIFWAFKSGVRMPQIFLISFQVLMLMLGLLGLVQIVNGTGGLNTLAFGMRTYFLHVPLIPIIGAVCDEDDVRIIGRHALLIMGPMALLMAWQFESSPEAWINKTVGDEPGLQLSSALGRIRTPGTFSFISGPVYFFPLVLAFLVDSSQRKIGKDAMIVQIAVAGLVLGMAVSGSRSLIASMLFVVAGLGLAFMIRPLNLGGLRKLAVWGVIAVLAISVTDIFRAGLDVLNARFDEANTFTSGGASTFERLGETFLEPFSWLAGVEFLGRGIGMGTLAGARLATGSADFALAEGEIGRIILECGPICSILYLSFRFGLAYFMLKESIGAAKRGNALPMALFGAGAMNVASGSWGQATTLGFGVLVGGLCLAAAKKSSVASSGPPRMMPPFRLPRDWRHRISQRCSNTSRCRQTRSSPTWS